MKILKQLAKKQGYEVQAYNCMIENKVKYKLYFGKNSGGIYTAKAGTKSDLIRFLEHKQPLIVLNRLKVLNISAKDLVSNCWANDDYSSYYYFAIQKDCAVYNVTFNIDGTNTNYRNSFDTLKEAREFIKEKARAYNHYNK